VRWAESHDGDQAGAALLHIEYGQGSITKTPTPTPFATATPTLTNTPTGTPTQTNTPLATVTPSPTPAASSTATQLPTGGTIDIRVAASKDDAEESKSSSMRLTSNDLELVYHGGNQKVGMRFNGIQIPPGATITNAYVQFQVDETSAGDTSLKIEAEAIDNAPAFVSAKNNISNRSRTAANMEWSPLPWMTVGEAGIDQRTPDLSSIIQEVVNRTGWVPGNSIVLVVTGSGVRWAESYDGDQAGAALLHIEYDQTLSNSLVQCRFCLTSRTHPHSDL
jgi:hypothetical protein